MVVTLTAVTAVLMVAAVTAVVVVPMVAAVAAATAGRAVLRAVASAVRFRPSRVLLVHASIMRAPDRHRARAATVRRTPPHVGGGALVPAVVQRGRSSSIRSAARGVPPSARV